jgi:thiosulfate reductase cytochrome b subunit
MSSLSLRCSWLIVIALLFAVIIACTTSDNPDQIRQRTAEATATMKRDTKAVVEGVKEGLGGQKSEAEYAKISDRVTADR